jgi:multidrug resistance efflux pump
MVMFKRYGRAETMRNEQIFDLADCSEFSQTIEARPPRFVHGSIILLVALLGTAVLWASLTKADLVVRASGRVRPVTAPFKVVHGGSGEILSASAVGRVVAVNFREGDVVRQGDTLVQLETERVDNEITRQKLKLQALESELTRLDDQERLLSQQFAETKAKAEAELAHAREQAQRGQDRQALDASLARIELERAVDEETRMRALVRNGLAPEIELAKATTRRLQNEERLKQAQAPIDAGQLDALRHEVTRTEKDHALQLEELALKRRTRQSEIEAVGVELSNLELERRQATIRAPTDGIVTNGELKVGEILGMGKPVAEIAAQKGFRLEVAVPSEEVSHLRLNMPARIKIDAYDYLKYGVLDGTVSFIAPDSGVAEGRRGAVYLVRIDLTSEEVGRGELRGRVRLGMTGQTEIITGRESLLSLLFRQIRQTISLG